MNRPDFKAVLCQIVSHDSHSISPLLGDPNEDMLWSHIKLFFYYDPQQIEL